MCGIVGFYSKKNMLDTLISGLKRLEYRGYDSAGVAIHTSKNSVYCVKAVGKVLELEKKIESSDIPELGVVGIAHTRWATHGEPTEDNAHPHFSHDKKIYVIHNGIIENYKPLKASLETQGIVFRSKTDTEIVANLISTNYKGDLKEAVYNSLGQLEGAYAFAIICEDEPDRIIAAKKGSPLLLGVGIDEIIVASDVSAIINCTKDVIYLEDGELVDIKNGQYRVTNFFDEDINKTIQSVDWNDEQATKEGYEHFLIKEIMEQANSVTESIRGRIDIENANVVFGGLLDVQDRINEINKIVLLGIGTSYYACKLGEMYIEDLTGIPTKAEMSPEFRYKSSTIDENTWVIALSQSGETADTISAIQEAKQKGALVTGIVNVVGSTVSRITDAGVYNHIGPEISVASTKAFTSSALILLLHAIHIGRKKKLSHSDGQILLEEIQKLPKLFKETLKLNDQIGLLAEKYYQSKDIFYLGRKYNYPIALEGALKLKEISHNIHSEALSGGELKHGFIALIDENRPTFAIATRDSVYEKMASNIEEVKARKGKVIAILSQADSDLINIVDDYVVVPQTYGKLQPLINNLVFQMFAYHCSRLNGFDVDRPRNLAKSVTVE
jgi:glutamine---fructose-6-phosphate transaminase (isomerizing)